MPDTRDRSCQWRFRDNAGGQHGVGGNSENGVHAFRRSVTGELRGPLCGMGICFECRVTIDGEQHCRSCQTVCENGMDVRTDE